MTQSAKTKKRPGGMRTLTAGLVLAISFTAGTLRAAAPAFAPVFNRGAVLQCELPVKVWGTADTGAAVSLLLDGNPVAETKAQPDGRWMLEIPPQKPGGPHTLEAKGTDASAQVGDVWFGEVWIASGQSNMVWPLVNSTGGAETLARTVPDIRFVKVPEATGLPPVQLTGEELMWKEFASPANQAMSAVAFYFADRIREETGRHVGILQTAVGGTPAQAWTPLIALAGNPALSKYAEEGRQALAAGTTPEQRAAWLKQLQEHRRAVAAWKKNNNGQPGPEAPKLPAGDALNNKTATVLWENMVAPLIPYTARGVIWYQGEANAGGPAEYRQLFPALIAAWRQAWQQPDWPFLFVQLAALETVNGKPAAGDWPGLRAAQAFTRDTVPHTGMALAIDSGERDDIHPKSKKPVGERLARLALAQVYARDIAARGPLLTKAETREGRVQLTFDHAGTGLKTSDGKAEVPGFELAGVDKKFHPATAKISGKDTVELLCPEVTAPASVRYAWSTWVEPPVTLQNSAGLPAEPSERMLP
jgi:sialate O-acetylesterase